METSRLVEEYSYGVQCHFQQYFCYIMVRQFYWWRKPSTCHWQT